MDLTTSINEAIMALWSRRDPGFGRTATVRLPLVYPRLQRGGLLIVGMNPSFSAKAFREFLTGAEWAGFDPVTFYAPRETPPSDYVERAMAVEAWAQRAYRGYYGKFSDVSAELGIDWQHIDLFLVRETDQEQLLLNVARDPKKGWSLANLSDFGLAQVNLCADVLRRIDPDIVVVANATASRILSAWLRPTFNEEHGHHWCGLEFRKVPIFFSSMWTGARALDVFSLERLRWQIRRARRHQVALAREP